MDLGACTVETGLLKKKPCGQKAVAKCANCEQSLCAKHTVPQMSAGKKTNLCPECAKAWKEQAKAVGDVPATPAPKPAAGATPPKPAAMPKEPPREHSGEAFTGGAKTQPKVAAPKPAAAPPKPAAAAVKKEAPKEQKKDDDDAPLEFTPTKK